MNCRRALCLLRSLILRKQERHLDSTAESMRKLELTGLIHHVLVLLPNVCVLSKEFTHSSVSHHLNMNKAVTVM